MSIIQYNNPVQIEWNTINGNRVSVQMQPETHKVVNNHITLIGIPDELYGITINGFTRIKDYITTLSTTNYRVNWQLGLIEFHSSQEGNSITVNSYKSRGILKYPASRIYLQDKDNLYGSDNVEDFAKEVTQRVDNLISGVEQPSEIVDARLNGVTNITHDNLKQRLDNDYQNLDNKVTSHTADIAINVKSFGAKGDGVKDDTTAIQNAINAATTSGRSIYFPKGVYLFSSTLNINYKGAVLVGTGKESSVLLANNCDGIYLSNYWCTIKGITITTNDNTKTAIKISGARHVISDVGLTGYDVNEDYWSTGIHCQDLQETEIKGVDFIGGNEGVHKRGYGIFAEYSINNKIFDSCHFISLDVGIYFDNTNPTGYKNEGWTILNNIFIACNYGINALTGVWLDISHNIMDQTKIEGIHLELSDGGSICDNWVAGYMGGSYFTGINLVTGQNITIANNSVYGDTYNDSAMRIASSNNIITGNKLNKSLTGIIITGNNNIIQSNSFLDCSSNSYNVTGNGNKIKDNVLNGIVPYISGNNYPLDSIYTDEIYIVATGQTYLEIVIPLPTGLFTQKPRVAFLQGIYSQFTATYLKNDASTTKDQVKFRLISTEGNFPNASMPAMIYAAGS